MAKLSDLVNVTAEVTGWSRNNVNLYARYAREAGYITQGARGLAAPDMTARDAAVLLAAMIGSQYAKDAGKTIKTLDETFSNVTRVDKFFLKQAFAEEVEEITYTWSDMIEFSPTGEEDENGAEMTAYAPHIETVTKTIETHRNIKEYLLRHSLIDGIEHTINLSKIGFFDTLNNEIKKNTFYGSESSVEFSVRENSNFGEMFINIKHNGQPGSSVLLIHYGVLASGHAGVFPISSDPGDLRTTRTISLLTLEAIGKALR